jgi:predicted kinase
VFICVNLWLILFVGLPGSGKSSFYRSNFADSHEHISKDLMPNVSNRDRRQQQAIEQALSSGKSVVVDNTSPRPEDRAPLIALGHRFQAQVIGYYFDCPVKECVARNHQRQDKARVPDVAIYVAAKRMKKPEYAEGFDEIYSVQLIPPASFNVTFEARK